MKNSYWEHSTGRPEFPECDHNLTVDVVVVGAGITGITTAYLLKKAGLSVALVERGRCGSGETHCTTAHLTYVTDKRLTQLISAFGRDHAQAIWHAGDAALLQLEDIISRESIECDFQWVPGYLHESLLREPDDEWGMLHKEALQAAELDFSADFLDSVPIVNRPGIRFADQAQFHPLKYLAGLVKRIPGDGSYVFEKSEVRDWDSNLNIHVGHHQIHCDQLVLATHVPLVNKGEMLLSNMFQTRLAAFNSYAIGARLPADTIEDALYWDTSHPYFYLRTVPVQEGNYVIFGGEDHKTGQSETTDACFARLEQRLKSLLPEAHVEERWSGQAIETTDGLPYIGETTPGHFIATGFAGNGMTFGTLAGMIIRDALIETSNPWRDLFAPTRTSLNGTWNYVKENMSYPYYMLRDRLARSGERSLKNLQRGEGCVLKIDGETVAAFRDQQGHVTRLSPVCPHLGCFVHWNSAEQTWDCPCHGSRFLATGEVHAGPARDPLSPICDGGSESNLTDCQATV